MVFPRITPYALMVVAGVLASSAVWADISAPANLKGTLGGLSTDTSAVAASSNVAALQSKVNALNTQIGANQSALARMSPSSGDYATTQSIIAQQRATVAALQRIITRLENGYTFTSYTTSTDASTQVTTITIEFSKTVDDGNGNTTTSPFTLTDTIPPVSSDYGYPATDSGAGTGDSGGVGPSDSADMLTQILQQAGMQMAMQPMGGMGNPMGNIQDTLNNLVTNQTPPANGKVSMCSADGKGKGVAVYDIAAGKVYMPNGEVLEAHSGMGAMMDNPAYVNQRMNGPTPPNVYNLSMRESPYYGVEALRMTPTDNGKMFGRDGILAHTKLVRGNNGSHGCVAFANYAQFLSAFKRGDVQQLVVVPKKEDAKDTCRPPEYDTPNPQSMGASS